MIFREAGGRVTLEMTQDQWAQLVLMLGFACGAVHDPELFRSWVGFVNELNSLNPNFRPYQVPMPKEPTA